MRKNTRFKFNQFMTRLAELNGVETDDMNKKFTVEPTVTQTLMNRVQESSDFLTRINIVPVSEMKGEKIGIGVSGSIASVTDTAGGDERETADFAALDKQGYECVQVNYDFHIRYNTLDLWARYEDFQARLRDAIVKRQALDRIMIGFNGVTRAKTSNRARNPMLQDVAVGWLQKYRNDAPARVMSKITDENGTVVSEKIRVGKNGDYANLDALVMDATNTLIEPWYQEDPELVVIVGRQLLADKYFPIVNQSQANTEQLAADVIISQKRIGGLPAVRVPYFPADAMFITRTDADARASQKREAELRLMQGRASTAALNREMTIQRETDANPILRDWSAAALPDDVIRLHARPAFASARDYLDWVSSRDKLPGAGQQP